MESKGLLYQHKKEMNDINRIIIEKLSVKS